MSKPGTDNWGWGIHEHHYWSCATCHQTFRTRDEAERHVSTPNVHSGGLVYERPTDD